MSKTLNTYRRPVAVDLFAGAGGFSLGIEQAGFDVLVAVEHDPVHACTYSFNFPLTEVLCANAVTLSGQEIKQAAYLALTSHHPQSGREWNGQIDLVFGGPPCQGFSLMGKRLLNDARNSLVSHFYRLVTELSPRYFVMENVPGMAVGEHKTLLQQLKTQFKTAGYLVREEILNAADYGVPQKRQRLFLIGSQADERPPDFPTPALCCRVRVGVRGAFSVGEAIADLPDLDNFPELLKTDEVLLSERQLHEMNQKASRYATVLRSSRSRCQEKGQPLYNSDNGGVQTDNANEVALSLKANSKPSSDTDNLSYLRLWNPQLLTSSRRTRHSEESIRRFEATAPNTQEPTSRLQRLDLNGLCPTLRAGTGPEQGSHTSPRPIHPTLPRVISVREAARLHSFPDWFRFHQTKWHGFRCCRQCGSTTAGKSRGTPNCRRFMNYSKIPTSNNYRSVSAEPEVAALQTGFEIANTYLKFQLDSDTTAAIELKNIAEVVTVHWQQLTPLPNTMPCILGLLYRQIRVLWVIDLAAMLRLECLDVNTPKYNIVIAKVG